VIKTETFNVKDSLWSRRDWFECRHHQELKVPWLVVWRAPPHTLHSCTASTPNTDIIIDNHTVSLRNILACLLVYITTDTQTHRDIVTDVWLLQLVTVTVSADPRINRADSWLFPVQHQDQQEQQQARTSHVELKRLLDSSDDYDDGVCRQ